MAVRGLRGGPAGLGRAERAPSHVNSAHRGPRPTACSALPSRAFPHCPLSTSAVRALPGAVDPWTQLRLRPLLCGTTGSASKPASPTSTRGLSGVHPASPRLVDEKRLQELSHPEHPLSVKSPTGPPWTSSSHPPNCENETVIQFTDEVPQKAARDLPVSSHI